MIKEWIDNIYNKGYEAGVNAQKLEMKEDHDRQLMEMYRFGYDRGQEEAKAEVGEIDGSIFEEMEKEMDA